MDHRRMSSLPGEAEAGERLKRTALRDVGPIPDSDAPPGKFYKLNLSRDDAPFPIVSNRYPDIEDGRDNLQGR